MSNDSSTSSNVSPEVFLLKRRDICKKQQKKVYTFFSDCCMEMCDNGFQVNSPNSKILDKQTQINSDIPNDIV